LAVAGVVLFVVGVVWWAWPTWAGRADRLDVLVVADRFAASPDAARSLDLRVREDGRLIEHAPFAHWCAAADAIAAVVDERQPRTVVATFAADGGCGDGAVRFAATVTAGGSSLVIVDQPGAPSQAALGGDRVDVVDPSPLLGAEPTATVLRCQWWETTCAADGTIAVRNDDGSLTAVGSERLARFVVAAL
jgi:hypothetical protein